MQSGLGRCLYPPWPMFSCCLLRMSALSFGSPLSVESSIFLYRRYSTGILPIGLDE